MNVLHVHKKRSLPVMTWPFLSSSVSILCPCVMCQDLKNGHRLTLKSPLPTPPTMKLFLVSYERYGQISTFLLQYYGTDFASIKRYDQFCLFTVVYKEAQILSTLSLFSLYFLSLLSLFSLSLSSLSSFSLLISWSYFSMPSLSLLIPSSLCLLISVWEKK